MKLDKESSVSKFDEMMYTANTVDELSAWCTACSRLFLVTADTLFSKIYDKRDQEKSAAGPH